MRGLVVLVWLLLCWVNTAWAYPSGAGGCDGPGYPAVGAEHLTTYDGTRPVTTGELADGDLQLRIDNVSVTAGMKLDINTDLTIQLSASAGAFRGVLFRLEPQTGDVDPGLSILPETATKRAPFCVGSAVGTTHISSADKTLATSTIRADTAGTVDLDVTVAMVNDDQESVYYYSGYTLAFEDAVPVAAPVAEPSPAPVTETVRPTSTPVAVTAPPSSPPATVPPTRVPFTDIEETPMALPTPLAPVGFAPGDETMMPSSVILPPDQTTEPTAVVGGEPTLLPNAVLDTALPTPAAGGETALPTESSGGETSAPTLLSGTTDSPTTSSGATPTMPPTAGPTGTEMPSMPPGTSMPTITPRPTSAPVEAPIDSPSVVGDLSPRNQCFQLIRDTCACALFRIGSRCLYNRAYDACSMPASKQAQADFIAAMAERLQRFCGQRKQDLFYKVKTRSSPAPSAAPARRTRQPTRAPTAASPTVTTADVNPNRGRCFQIVRDQCSCGFYKKGSTCSVDTISSGCALPAGDENRQTFIQDVESRYREHCGD